MDQKDLLLGNAVYAVVFNSGSYSKHNDIVHDYSFYSTTSTQIRKIETQIRSLKSKIRNLISRSYSVKYGKIVGLTFEGSNVEVRLNLGQEEITVSSHHVFCDFDLAKQYGAKIVEEDKSQYSAFTKELSILKTKREELKEHEKVQDKSLVIPLTENSEKPDVQKKVKPQKKYRRTISEWLEDLLYGIKKERK